MDIHAFDNLIDGYFDDRLSPGELEQFNAALRGSEQARQRFWQHARFESWLIELGERKRGEDASHRIAPDDALQILRELEDLAEPELREIAPLGWPGGQRPPTPLERARQLFDDSRPVVYALAAAAILCIAVLIGWELVLGPGGGPTTPLVQADPSPSRETDTLRPDAVVRNTHDARWGGANLKPGAALKAGTPYTLRQGAVELDLASGAKVMLRAPASFEVRGNQINLGSGQAFAVVPKSAIGFTIDTPQGRVVDLGTEFGVRVDERGFDEVVVFKGLVETASKGSADAPVKIPENWGATLRSGSPVSQSLKPIASFQTLDFIRDWDALIYNPAVVDGVYHKQAPPSLVDDAFEADLPQVIAEARGVELKQPLEVIRLYPGKTTQLAGGAGHRTIEAGTRVNTFLVHFDRVGEQVGTRQQRIELTFPGEVLGVLSGQEELIATDMLLGAPGTRYPKPGEDSFRATLDPFGSPSVEKVWLDADRRRVVISFVTSNIDAVRVVVRNTDDVIPE